MKRVWLITNHASGSAGAEKCVAIEALFAERGVEFAGRTVFPAERLPDAAALDAAGADTAVLFAGDGTINAAACKLDRWGGAMLILPGGTMNMLARELHGEADAAAIVHAAHGGARAIKLPFVEAGPHRAFVALIVGPTAAWARARELVREGALAKVGQAVAFAWEKSWSETIAVTSAGARRDGYNAVILTPRPDSRLSIAAVAAERWSDLAQLGWEWLTGDWHDAGAVDDSRAREATIDGKGAVHALFDGEEAKLQSPIAVRAGLSRLGFISTVAAPA